MTTWKVYQPTALDAVALANEMVLEGKANVRIFKDEDTDCYGVSYTE